MAPGTGRRCFALSVYVHDCYAANNKWSTGERGRLAQLTKCWNLIFDRIPWRKLVAEEILRVSLVDHQIGYVHSQLNSTDEKVMPKTRLLIIVANNIIKDCAINREELLTQITPVSVPIANADDR